jgi:hypothetical protein
MFNRLGKVKAAAQGYLDQYKQQDPAAYAAAQQAIGGVLILDGLIGIDNPFEGRKRSGIFGSLIGIFMGTVFLFVPMIFNGISGLNKMTATTTATVVSIKQDTSSSSDSGSSCTAVAQYDVDGKQYQQQSSFGSGSFCGLTPGSTIPISYDPNNPGAWGYQVQMISNIMKIFPIAGAIVAISSFVTFIIRLLSIYFGWKLLQSGRALAKTLPAGTDLNTVIAEIKRGFTQHLFNFGGGTAPASMAQPAAGMPAAPPVAPQPQQVQQPYAQAPQQVPPAAPPIDHGPTL